MGDLEVAWASSEGRARFLTLPLKGVQLLLGDASSRLAYENTVLVAAAAWVQLRGDGVSDEDKQRLAWTIRCPFLTPFGFGLAMAVPWLVEAHGAPLIVAASGINAVLTGTDAPSIKAMVTDCKAMGWQRAGRWAGALRLH